MAQLSLVDDSAVLDDSETREDTEETSLQSGGPALDAPFFRSAEALGLRFRRSFPPTRLFDLTPGELEDLLDEQDRERFGHLKDLLSEVFDPTGRSASELLDRPETVARFIATRIADPQQEVLGAFYVDMRNRCIAWSVPFRGTLTRAAVEPRAILSEALRLGAAGVIVFHTHPTGEPEPSQEDLDFTFRLAQGAELLGVRLMDHVIVGSWGSWVSLKQRGAW